MIERRVARDRDGGIERIVERKLGPIEEVVEMAWPGVKHLLRSREFVNREVVEIEIRNVVPRNLHEQNAIINGLCNRLVSEADAFTGTKWKTIIWTFPGVRQS